MEKEKLTKYRCVNYPICSNEPTKNDSACEDCRPKTFKEAYEHDKALDEKGDTTTHRILSHSSDMVNDCFGCKALKA